MNLHAFRDFSIRRKLFVSYFLFVALSLCLFLAVNTVLSVRQNETQTLRSAEHVFGQTRDYLQFKTESVRNLLYLLGTNQSLQEIFERRSGYYTQEIGRWPIDSQALEKLLYPTSVNPDVAGIRFYMRYSLASVYRNDRFIPFSAVAGRSWFRHLLADNRRTWWFVDEEQGSPAGRSFVRVARSVFSSQDINELTGIIQFDIPEQVLRATLGNALLTESTAVLLLNEQGQTVSSAGVVSLKRDGELWRKASARSSVGPGGVSWSTVSLPGAGAFLVGTQGIENSDWTLLLVVPYRDIVRLSSRPLRQMLLVLLLIIPLSMLFALVVSRSATRRFQDLMAGMKKVVNGDFSVTLRPQNRDEIGQLTESFNIMISEIEQLVDEKYRLGKEVKQLELKALQAQINPHFLYNTLDLINWMSLKYEAEEIRAVVNALSRFYKLSLGRGEDTVRLRDEIEHARAYVQIQNMRYEDSIRLEVDVPEELLDCPILKLVAQPLVENAILHGIMLKPDEKGTIRISAALDGPALVVSVEDDGAGMSEETLRSVMSGTLQSADHHGYGVRNIHERLFLNYGEGYGLVFASAPGAGTRVEIRVPAVTPLTSKEEKHERSLG
jgi:two-component system sensor histidine kinase YesM